MNRLTVRSNISACADVLLLDCKHLLNYKHIRLAGANIGNMGLGASSSKSGGPADRRFRNAANSTASEPNPQAVLQLISALICSFAPHALIGLLLPDEQRGVAALHTVPASTPDGVIPSSTEVQLKGTAAGLAFDRQQPVLLEDGHAELLRYPELAASLKGEPIGGFYAFPVSTSQRRLGVLLVATKSAVLTNS